MPLEMEYADDVDLLDEEREPLETLLPVAAVQLKDVNLLMNEAKIGIHPCIPGRNK